MHVPVFVCVCVRVFVCEHVHNRWNETMQYPLQKVISSALILDYDISTALLAITVDCSFVRSYNGVNTCT